MITKGKNLLALMWHDNQEEEYDQKEDIKPTIIKRKFHPVFHYGIVVLAVCLFFYFTVVFLSQKLYDQARFNLLNTMGLEQPESQENFFVAISEYNKLIRS